MSADSFLVQTIQRKNMLPSVHFSRVWQLLCLILPVGRSMLRSKTFTSHLIIFLPGVPAVYRLKTQSISGFQQFDKSKMYSEMKITDRKRKLFDPATHRIIIMLCLASLLLLVVLKRSKLPPNMDSTNVVKVYPRVEPQQRSVKRPFRSSCPSIRYKYL